MAQSSICLGHGVQMVSRGVGTSKREAREMPGLDSGLTGFLSRTRDSLLTFENEVPCGSGGLYFLKRKSKKANIVI